MFGIIEHARGNRKKNHKEHTQPKQPRPLHGSYGKYRLGGTTDNYRHEHRRRRRQSRFIRNLPSYYPRYVNQPVYVNPRVAYPTYVPPHYTWYNPYTWWYEGFENERDVNCSMLAVLIFLVVMLYLMKKK